jgi:predicted DCC family thiol-disulfide oxidoreductase YuxK
MPLPDTNAKSIILFDGVCNLCNGFVQFIIKHDKAGRFVFGMLQSEHAAKMLADYNYNNKKMKSVILIEDGKIFSQSTAALRIVKKLDGGWKLFYAFIIFPAFLRDGVYAFIAKYRYSVFGRTDSCMIPTADLKKKFID